MTVITLSASYGAGGSRVGPELARRLGAPFVDRAIPAAVANRLAVPIDEALAHDQSAGSVLDRLLALFAPTADLVGAPQTTDVPIVDARSYLEATEAVIREQAARGPAVILGRAGAVVLADAEDALHVRLDGPPERRVEQAIRVQGIDRETAERQQRETDRARETYLQHFYRLDTRDPTLYHLVIDSTAIGLDACTDIIERAVRARADARRSADAAAGQ